MKIKVAVVEDEELAYKNIQNHLLRYGKEKGQEFEIFYFSNGEKFLNEYELGGGVQYCLHGYSHARNGWLRSIRKTEKY